VTSPCIEICVPARLEYVGVLRDGALALGNVLVARGLNVLPETVRAWALAIYEAGTNVVRHGYAGGSQEPIVLLMEMYADHVVFVMQDEGLPNHLWNHPKRPGVDGEGGYGMVIIRTIMHEVSYGRDGQGRNELRLVARFNVTAPT
jgi:anti-sigma regulatory factor (Ser/Thr protein kinase)